MKNIRADRLVLAHEGPSVFRVPLEEHLEADFLRPNVL
jgi:hypothetical protein